MLKKTVFLGLALIGLLVSCSNPTSSVNQSSSSQENTSSESSSSSNEAPTFYHDYDGYELINKMCSISGIFIDLTASKRQFILETDSSYMGGISPTDSPSPVLTVTSSEHNVITIEYDENNPRSITLVTHYEGNSLIQVKDSQGITLWQDVVYTRPIIPASEILSWMYNNIDAWQSPYILGNEMRGIMTDPQTMYLEGIDEYAECSGTITLGDIESSLEEQENMKEYAITVTTYVGFQTGLKPQFINIARNGCMFVLIGNNMAINFFYPSTTN